MYNVVVISPIHEKGMQVLHARSDLLRATVLQDRSPENQREQFRDAHALLVRTSLLPADLLSCAPHLKIVSRHGVGTDNIDVAYLTSRGIPMAIAVDSNVDSVAEHTLMFLLALAKDLVAGDKAVRTGDFGWRDQRTAGDLCGKVLLILGFGRIGQKVAQVCLPLGMRVLAYDPYIRQSPVDGAVMVEDFRQHLGTADYVSLHLPSTPETMGLFDATMLGSLKHGACLINCARGGIIDEDALCEVLRAGHVRAAALDVFASEPPDVSHPLFGLPNVLFSPHNAALTEECAERMAVQSAQNIVDCLEGRLAPRVVINARGIGMSV